jgi:hypothetical protein
MSLKRSVYVEALQQCAGKLRGRDGAQGTEHIVRDAVAAQLRGAQVERPLSLYGGVAPDGALRARIDIVAETHGIELKAVRMPRSANNSPNSSLYDLGQLANDYLKLESAKKLESGELLILLYGTLVEGIGQAGLYREFHNRMFVDYATSRQFGELRKVAISECAEDWKQKMRKAQLKAIRKMELDKPCSDARRCWVYQHGEFALVSIPVR